MESLDSAESESLVSSEDEESELLSSEDDETASHSFGKTMKSAQTTSTFCDALRNRFNFVNIIE